MKSICTYKKNSNTFKYILQIQYVLQVNEFGVFLSFCKAYNLSYSFITIHVVYWRAKIRLLISTFEKSNRLKIFELVYLLHITNINMLI